jgi:phosphoglycerate dehydrogenase-like enzyme
VGRGKVVDEKALIEALTSGHLAAEATLDCEEEPLSAENPL